MSFRMSSVAPQLASQSPTHSQSTTSIWASKSTTDREENLSDCLIIEDLDLADLDLSPSTERSSSPTPDESTQDIYYQADVDNFFRVDNFFGEEIPSVVSEACVVTDLYILVKVPTKPRNHVATSTTCSQTTPRSARPSTSSCFMANRKIFPIPEEEIEDFIEKPKSKIPVPTQPKSKKTCWTNESDVIEEFPSTTSVIHHNDTVPLPNQVPEQAEEEFLNVVHRRESSLPCQNQIELQEVDLNSDRFEGSKNVSLKNYGILITPTKACKTDNLLVFQVDTEPKEKVKNSGRLASCFEWLTKFFRRKRRKARVVQAKVYKTYFVKWKKCPEDNQCPSCRCRTHTKSRRQSA